MKVNGKKYCSVWLASDNKSIHIFNQEKLPYEFDILTLSTVEQVADAIITMKVRGAPLIGCVGAYGMALAMSVNDSEEMIDQTYNKLVKTRPTAINLEWALSRMCKRLRSVMPGQRAGVAYDEAEDICNEDKEINRQIGLNGLELIRKISSVKKDGEPVNILTHCNAGWLATVDWGTATAPVYMAYDEGIKIHVWVDETRPRNQGALTAFELGRHGVPHTLIADNVGGHLMQHGLVDLVIVGADRVTARGDVCNKIGTYLKALAAKANQVPFYVALPSPTIDSKVFDGVKEIPIEQRSGSEQSHVKGISSDGVLRSVNTVPEGTVCANYAFDVTPAELITGLITERGVCEANYHSIKSLFPEVVSENV